jgi:hypothetical protein
MPGMASTPSQPTLTDWDEEKAKQDEIAAPVKSTLRTPSEEETTVDEVIVEVPQVTIRPKADVELDYPIAVSVVGSDDLVFNSDNDTVEVPAPVAEQITYSSAVEVAV